ncbi:hypothetical protein [Flavobacterium phage FL-1]|nr:hypothetical protein [Flavobacterium phage FL-1]
MIQDNPDIRLLGGFIPQSANSHVFQVTPEQFIGGDTSRINQAINFASTNSVYNVVCNGTYYLDSAILMKSNVNLINNGKIIMNSGMKDNMIRAASTVVGTPISNFKIKGVGLFQGSSDTWGSDNPSGVNGEAWRSIAILLANASDFEIEGITIKNSHGWGINMEQSRYGSVKNIHFDNDGSKSNQDGVNVRHGSHHIVIENISGVTHDDIVAVTNLLFGNAINYLGQTIYESGKANFNSHDITIRNINRHISAGTIGGFTPPVKKGGITIMCHDGLKVYNVSIDGVTGDAQIYIQFNQITYWVTSPGTVNDVYNLNISNINDAPVYFGIPIKNSSLINIPKKDITGTYNSGVFPAGSLNVTRKYNDGDFEFFATV